MSKKKKRKHIVPSQAFNWNPSKNHLEYSERVAKKVLQLIGLAPAIFNVFTKKQKHFLLQWEKAIPRIRIAEGSEVSGRYLDYTRAHFFKMMKKSYIDENQEVGLTYFDLITYGIAFYGAVLMHVSNEYFPTEHIETLQLIAAKFEEFNLFTYEHTQLMDVTMLSIVSSLTQVQFRVYGYNLRWTALPNRYIGLLIEIHSHAPESIRINYLGETHIAYKMFLGNINGKGTIIATIDFQKIFPTQTVENNRELTIYIQDHAIRRMKERLDVAYPMDRTNMLMDSLIFAPEVRLGPDNQPMFCCKQAKVVIGYFPFILKKDKIIITTFLPLTFSATNEGKQLQKRFHLQAEDIKHLGMDKLRFLVYTDFDEIPTLKQALIDAGIYNVVALFERNPKITPQMIAKSTQAVKKFLGC